MEYVYFTPDDRLRVLALNTHCRPAASQRNVASGFVETTASSTAALVDVDDTNTGAPVPVTTPGVPMEFPSASHTRNLTGTVLPFLNTLVPSASTGCRTVRPGAPRHGPLAYTTR